MVPNTNTPLSPYSGLPQFLQEKIGDMSTSTEDYAGVSATFSIAPPENKPHKPKRKSMFPETRKALKNFGWWRIAEAISAVGLVYYGIAAAPEQYNWLLALLCGAFWIILLMLGSVRDRLDKLCRKRKRQPSVSTPKMPEISPRDSEAPTASLEA